MKEATILSSIFVFDTVASMAHIIRSLIVLFFITFLLFITVITVYSPTEVTSEQRPLTVFPSLPSTVTDLQAFFQQIDNWATDRMHYRQLLISEFNKYRLKLGLSPLHNVMAGRDRWLFYTKDGELEDARGTTVFTPTELAHWKAYLLYRNQIIQQRGATFVFVLLPNKSTVYADYLPAHLTQLSNQTRLQQLSDAMKDTPVTVVDARPILLSAKQQGAQVFLKSDTHWNLLGANFVQFAIAKELTKTHPTITPILYSYHNATAEEYLQLRHPSDLNFLMGLQETDHGPIVPVVENIGRCTDQANPEGIRIWPLALGDCSRKVPSRVAEHWSHLTEEHRASLFRSTDNPDRQLSLLMIHDSFFEMLQPFFSNQFKHVDYVGIGRPIEMGAWDAMLDIARPDIVIEEMIERHLKSTVPRPGIDYPATDSMPIN